MTFVFHIEQNEISEAIIDEHNSHTMIEELYQFERNIVKNLFLDLRLV